MLPRAHYNPDRDIPDLSGKVFFITGGTAGLGRQAVLNLCKHNPKHIYFTGRNTANASSLISEIEAISPSKITFLNCDQSSLTSVSQAAKHFLVNEDRLDVLICNAGVMALPPSLTKDGYEAQFGINHVGHALFIKHLLPILEQTSQQHAEARIVSLASLGASHTTPGGIAFESLRTSQDFFGMTAKWMRYGQSKLANILYASELAMRYPSLTVVSLEPGTVWTGLISNLGWFDRLFIWLVTWWKTIDLHEGAYNTCWAATIAEKEIESGSMYQPVGDLVPASGYMKDEDLAGKLWEWTEEQLKPYE
ncbi:dehydrogenase with different specificitie [Lindgomyces ingoldianus]|uniref:Dehydrogenase with different specificitie n=1 Tax=Lindgomyces ingoldianus TaxID=673940 RepID=A0ACB6QKT0_9PLEO|nr:dehydrogenase with different specificitie [Lindgomyces ingoldianus]KAF2467183.1 dehydrogenase with different specificitie [Lindgomyces ingoldianus]